jgi:hypothetical protein
MRFNLIGIMIFYVILNISFQMGQEYAYREVNIGLLNKPVSLDAIRARIEKRRSEFDLITIIRYLNDKMHHPPRKS